LEREGREKKRGEKAMIFILPACFEGRKGIDE